MCWSPKNKLAIYNVWLTYKCPSLLLCEKGKDINMALISFHEWWDSSFSGGGVFLQAACGPGRISHYIHPWIYGWSVELGQHSKYLRHRLWQQTEVWSRRGSTFLLQFCIKSIHTSIAILLNFDPSLACPPLVASQARTVQLHVNFTSVLYFIHCLFVDICIFISIFCISFFFFNHCVSPNCPSRMKKVEWININLTELLNSGYRFSKVDRHEKGLGKGYVCISF